MKLTKKEKTALKKVSKGFSTILENLSYQEKKAVLRATEKLTQTNCWWFEYGIKDAIHNYLDNVLQTPEGDPLKAKAEA